MKFIILFLFFLIFSLSVPAQTSPRRAKRQLPKRIVGVVGVSSSDTWREIYSEQGGFKIWFPGSPVAPRHSPEIRQKAAPLNSGTYFLQTPRVYYSIFFSESDIDVADAEKLKAFYDSRRESFLSGSDLKIISETDVFLDKHPGRERISSDSGGTSLTKTRLFQINGMRYELNATASKKDFDAEAENIDKFLTSFRLSELPPKKPEPVNYEAAWREFVSKEGNFKADFPGIPEKNFIPGSKGAKKSSIYYSAVSAGANFTVMVLDYPYVIEDPETLNSAYENTLGYFREKPENKLLGFKEVFLGKHPGRELFVKDTNRESFMRARFFIIGDRMYQIGVWTPDAEETQKKLRELYDKSAARFFESFELIASPTSVAEIAKKPLPEGLQGEITDEAVYQNTFFNFELDLPEEWQLLNKDELELVLEAGKIFYGHSDARENARVEAAHKRLITLFAISKEDFGLPGNAMFWAMAEKSVNPALGLRELAALNQKPFIGKSRFPAIITRQIYETKIGGANFAAFEGEIEATGTKVRQKMFFTRRKGYDLTFILIYTKDEDLKVMETAFNSLKFKAGK
ncbi:MAG TPA: hypothetical protein VEX64_08880 [Pyrinomonadaceae bacterium]|nr:hypothetical protein [Pyrinomonadaceae bacterium]